MGKRGPGRPRKTDPLISELSQEKPIIVNNPDAESALEETNKEMFDRLVNEEISEEFEGETSQEEIEYADNRTTFAKMADDVYGPHISDVYIDKQLCCEILSVYRFFYEEIKSGNDDIKLVEFYFDVKHKRANPNICVHNNIMVHEKMLTSDVTNQLKYFVDQLAEKTTGNVEKELQKMQTKLSDNEELLRKMQDERL